MSIIASLALAASPNGALAEEAGHTEAAACDDPVIMAVMGPTHDRERMIAYAQAIAATGMYQRLGAYYLNGFPIAHFEGEAPENHALLLVRFPCLENAKAFWYSDEYQNNIVPMRQNPSAGDYLVRVYPEIALREDIVGKVGSNAYIAEFNGSSIPDVPRYADPADLVIGADADDIEPHDYNTGWADRVLLREGDKGDYVARITVKSERGNTFGKLPRNYQVYVLNGELTLAGFTLGGGDFLHLPQGSEMGAVSGKPGTTYLLFGDAPQENAPEPDAPLVSRGTEVDWRPGTVAQDAGEEVALYIKPLWTDEETGARVHLVQSAAGVAVPWEIHPGVEEAYLLEGDYHLKECLPSGLKSFDYNPGGYLYRPGGLMHSGPDSTSSAGATWLIRTQEKLTAVFYPYCPSAPVPEESE
ncbi:cupin domain-containing protein [Altererythrobacter sp. MF3-039]|uniref:cupin domain-containing protein n=1 Tax=Altererythrobacter sp. MF3-039 TaxID=3252901 RepID=UPI00390C54BE